MAKSKVTLLLLPLLLAALPRLFASIDFTPGHGERVLEGIKFPELYFHENGRKISYEQPRGWSYTGDAARIRFIPPYVPQAFGEMAQAPLPAPQNFDEPTMKALQERALQAVPADSQNVTLVGVEKNPLMINQHETFEVTVAYQLYGEQYHRSVLFMNLSDTQLTFALVARKPDFDKLHAAFRGSLCSLQWL
jgi:hypothetical protein